MNIYHIDDIPDDLKPYFQPSPQIGLEKTPDEYVVTMVQVFREVKRILRDDGTLWLNLGDSYAGSWGNYGGQNRGNGEQREIVKGSKAHQPSYDGLEQWRPPTTDVPGLKPKDLCGIPWSVAKALQQPYYVGRISSERDRVWLAATIDAEGTICGFHHTRKDDGSLRTGIHLTITNTNRLMLDNAYRIWPTSKEDHNPHGEGHYGSMPIWRWIAHNVNDKSALLQELYPYFVTKQKQALLAWNFLELSKDSKRLGRSGEASRVKEKRSWVVHALTKLNHLQTVDIPDWITEPPSLYESGWYLRSDIIWAKPNPMPESVTDRPTKSHEYVFLMSKSARYYYDSEAVKEEMAEGSIARYAYAFGGSKNERLKATDNQTAVVGDRQPTNGRNLRSVWTIATQPSSEAHFAMFPEALVVPCIKAGTSEHGVCPECGAPWERVVEKGGGATGESWHNHEDDLSVGQRATVPESKGGHGYYVKTIGWWPTCKCGREDRVQATVLDPFSGMATVGVVCNKLGRKYIGIELNPKYAGRSGKRKDKAANMFSEIV